MDWGLVVGILGVPASIALTMGATSRGEFHFIRGCFIAVACGTVGAHLWWQWANEAPLTGWRVAIGGLVGAVTVAGLVVALDWVKRKQIAATPGEAAEIVRPIENRWTWAALTPSESDSLYEKLRGKEQYSFHIACNRPECSNLAISFDRLFKRLGWPSFVGDGGFLATGVTGILINPADAGAKLLKSAIETTTILRPDLGSLRGKDTTSPIMLVIGTKPEILATGPMQATKELEAQSSKPQLQPHATESKPSPPPSGVRKYAIDGLMNARDDLLSLKRENLSCDALSSWQARADAATRLAHANGIGVHNPISQYLGACKNITDVDLLDAIRGDIVRLLNQGIQGAGG
jgi:hypothetical protein